ncbi:MAG: UvrD-helicase domain-containing protein [Clostridia bacterium]|nr:UvrD-helicase domain-containing protein [Clostridia bacterium]
MLKDEFLELRRRIIAKDFQKMNDKQQEAIFTTEGPLLLLAGAGSGKTTVLVNRIANLIKYGSAYYSDECDFEPTETDVALMREYLQDDTVDLFDVYDLLCVRPARPWEILAITFTNKAATELKERLSKMLGDAAMDIWASTFHSSCARILRRYGDSLGYSSHFTIYDTDDSKRVMKQVQKLLSIDDKMLSHKVILKEVSNAKDQMISPEEYLQQAGNDFRMKKIGEAYERYQKLLKTADAMDFDDIIYNTVKLLENNEEVRKYYQNKFRYVMVDEYQDTNHAQYRLTTLLAGKYQNICVVGDDDQSIYRFRGATIENILSFEDQYTNAKVIRLEQNYRSTQNILDAANAVIAHNVQRKGKNLWTSNGTGDKITVNVSYDENDEAKYIADAVSAEVAKGKSWNDVAVLYRMNAQSNNIENAFIRSGVPYRIIGGLRFYERKEVKDALAYLTVINNVNDEVRLRRIINEPKRGIGETSLNNAAEIAAGMGTTLFDVIAHADEYPALSRASKKMLEFAAFIKEIQDDAESLALDQLLETILKKSGYYTALSLDKETYEDRMGNLAELKNNLLRYQQENEDGDLNGFLEDIALMTDIDNYNASNETVTMMTLHSAKGLEFPIVFIPGMEEGIFPGIQSVYNPADVEEERRLAYVGITRAKKQLFMTYARTRLLFGSTSHNAPSRFLKEIPDELVEHTGVTSLASGRVESKSRTSDFAVDSPMDSYYSRNKINRGFSKPATAQKPKSAPSVSYSVGDTVKHKIFGTGVILKVQPVANDTLLEIAFDKAGTKKLMANFAKLTKEE